MSNALQFNGSSDKVSFGNILTGQTVVTAALWFQITSTPTSNSDVVFGYGNTYWFFIHAVSSTAIRFSGILGGIEKSSGNTPALSLNTWYFAIGTYDPSGGTNNMTIRIYDNGGNLVTSSSATQTGALGATTKALEIAHDPNRNFFWKGMAQKARIYNRVLSVAEQDVLAKFGEPDATSLVGLWQINEGSGTTVADTSGNGNTGTLTGSTWVGGATTTSTTTSSSTSTTTSTSSSTSTSTSTSTTTTWPYQFEVDEPS